MINVVPRHVLPRRHFTAGAIALALLLFGNVALTAQAAAKAAGSWAQGPAAWRTLRRWIGAVDTGHLFPCVRGAPVGWSPRQRAARAAMTLASLVPAAFSTDERVRVFAAAALAA